MRKRLLKDRALYEKVLENLDKMVQEIDADTIYNSLTNDR